MPNENVRPVFVAVALADIVMVVLFTMFRIYAPAGMPVPLIACPTDNVDVLETVTVALPLVVAPVPMVLDVAVAFADSVIEFVLLLAIVVPAEMPEPLIGIPAKRYVVSAMPLTVVLPLVVIPLICVVSLLVDVSRLSKPRKNCPRRSGRLNVVEPSPVPQVVLMTANSVA